jgi:hypothetical protein
MMITEQFTKADIAKCKTKAEATRLSGKIAEQFATWGEASAFCPANWLREILPSGQTWSDEVSGQYAAKWRERVANKLAADWAHRKTRQVAADVAKDAVREFKAAMMKARISEYPQAESLLTGMWRHEE